MAEKIANILNHKDDIKSPFKSEKVTTGEQESPSGAADSIRNQEEQLNTLGRSLNEIANTMHPTV